jgi:hypothetical protein
MVAGQTVYYIDPNFTLTALGTIAPGTSIVSMADNGTTVLLVDGTTAGYTIDIQSKAMAPIVMRPSTAATGSTTSAPCLRSTGRGPSSSISRAPMP